MTSTEILFTLAVAILLIVLVALSVSLSRADAEIKDVLDDYYSLLDSHVALQIENEHNEDLLLAATARTHKTDDDVAALIEGISPLVEKTDWMTGRWGGQFATLTAMENARNAQVDLVRTIIMNTPLVKEQTDNLDPIAFLESASAQAMVDMFPDTEGVETVGVSA